MLPKYKLACLYGPKTEKWPLNGGSPAARRVAVLGIHFKVSVLCDKGTSVAAQWEGALITTEFAVVGRGKKKGKCEHPKPPLTLSFVY